MRHDSVLHYLFATLRNLIIQSPRRAAVYSTAKIIRPKTRRLRFLSREEILVLKFNTGLAVQPFACAGELLAEAVEEPTTVAPARRPEWATELVDQVEPGP